MTTPHVSLLTVAGKKLEQKRRDAVRSRDSHDQHAYFQSIAEARFVLRKVFRIVEEQAKAVGLDPLGHHALLQIYGNSDMKLRISELAERLDISAAFASALVKKLHRRGLVACARSTTDQRVTRVTVTKTGRAMLHQIDSEVQFHVDYFTRQLSRDQKERAVAILLFYVGLAVEHDVDE